jgi:tryptophanyl-tRNA synthetase
MEGHHVTPFDVGTVDNYDKLVKEFGCTPMSTETLARFERLTGVAVPPGYRDFIVSHRDFELVLDDFEHHRPFYLYTGRGPSSDSMHLGHLVPFFFCKFLQDAFHAKLVIQITDDEKFIFKEDLTLSLIEEMARKNITDIIACGFDVDRTFIFTNTSFIGHLYPMVLKLNKLIPVRQIASTFGFPLDGADTSVGKFAFPTVQCAPAFAETFASTLFRDEPKPQRIRCLIPCAIDQDPYFRLCRVVAGKLKHSKPAVIHTKFLPGLMGVDTKMSSSIPKECIFLNDAEKQMRRKIGSAFSGGQEMLEDHRRLGGDPNRDVAYRLLCFFLNDTAKLRELSEGFQKGEITCGEMKKMAADVVANVVKDFKERREKIDGAIYAKFTDYNK